MENTINFREACSDDCKLLFEWANQSEVRENAFSAKSIEWEEHKNWFYGKMESKNSHIFILCDNQNSPVGQVRYDIDDGGVAEVDINIDASFRGRNYGTWGLKKTSTHVLDKLWVKKIIAHIKKENLVSLKAFEKAGFINQGVVIFKNEEVYKMLSEEEK
ncbi:MAG: GNAT family N-acetyltransferase [Candidatus Omnitrophota bacterium]